MIPVIGVGETESAGAVKMPVTLYEIEQKFKHCWSSGPRLRFRKAATSVQIRDGAPVLSEVGVVVARDLAKVPARVRIPYLAPVFSG